MILRQFTTRMRRNFFSRRVKLGSLIVLAALLRFPTLGLQSFWDDEGYTVGLFYFCGQGEPNEGGQRAAAGFFHHGGAVIFDGALADPKIGRDGLAGAPL